MPRRTSLKAASPTHGSGVSVAVVSVVLLEVLEEVVLVVLVVVVVVVGSGEYCLSFMSLQ